MTAARSRSRRTKALNGLHGVRLVHTTCAEELQSLSDEGGILEDLRCQETVDNQTFIFKSHKVGSTQNFRPWDDFPFKKFWENRPTWLRTPISHDHGDSHFLERVANVLTSVPFILIGLQAPRKRLVTKLYANSIVGVGLASSVYHASRGDARKFFRWGDYTMIATSALATFVQRVSAEPRLKKSHSLHTASSLIGCALFIADDVFPKTPFIHAAWHLAAAIGVASCFKLLE